MKKPDQDHIRIYYNGLKVDGGKLIRCYYSINETADGIQSVTIYARDYKDLPRDLLPVVNESDSMTDYFEDDRATLTPDHPLFPFVIYAAEKARARDDAAYCDRLREQLDSGRPECWPGHDDMLRQDLERREAFLERFAGAQDPGQPSAANLERIAAGRREADEARRAAELEANLEREERSLIERSRGRRLIETASADAPVREGEPVVTINWSEHPAFYGWKDGALTLSVAAADRILYALDLKVRNDPERGYYKTSFTITGTDPDGEPLRYDGRFDIGDGEGGLIRHICNYGEWERTHGEFGQALENPPDTNDRLRFAYWLQGFVG